MIYLVFTVDRIAGAESPIQLARYIRTAGWRPVGAEVRVTSVDRIVRLFGGRLLYGHDLSVPLRELIQNASDAVRARRALAEDPFYEGKVVVSLKNIEGDSWRLIVEDDGIGMSERVLIGPLLEFGKSFWASEEAQDEFPGLLSAKLCQTGRYGIGFFSTLMIAERIEVTTRRWDAAQDQARKLTFREGLQLRPLITKAEGASLGQLSTRVELHITSESVEQLLRVSNAPPPQEYVKVTLKELIAHLCPCLGCDVFILQCDDQYEVAHYRKWYETDTLQWVRQIIFADHRTNQTVDDYLAKIAPLIHVIEGQDGEPCGRAAVAFLQIEAGIDAVGGLASRRSSRTIGGFSASYVGAIGVEPAGPNRDSGILLNPDKVKAWASEQALLLAEMKLNDLENYIAAANVASLGGDPTPIATILINRQLTTLINVYDLLVKEKEIYAVLGSPSGPVPSLSMIYHRPTPYHGIGLSAKDLNFSVATMEAWPGLRFPEHVYHRIPTSENPASSCFLSCLERHAHSKGRELQMEPVSNVLFGTYKGEPSSREKLAVGTELRENAIRLSLI